ncbi:hypothetical protein JNB11_00490 [Kocuria palustris]|nr:hypothetical protein [Kocuria palustris]
MASSSTNQPEIKQLRYGDLARVNGLILGFGKGLYGVWCCLRERGLRLLKPYLPRARNIGDRLVVASGWQTGRAAHRHGKPESHHRFILFSKLRWTPAKPAFY